MLFLVIIINILIRKNINNSKLIRLWKVMSLLGEQSISQIKKVKNKDRLRYFLTNCLEIQQLILMKFSSLFLIHFNILIEIYDIFLDIIRVKIANIKM